MNSDFGKGAPPPEPPRSDSCLTGPTRYVQLIKQMHLTLVAPPSKDAPRMIEGAKHFATEHFDENCFAV